MRTLGLMLLLALSLMGVSAQAETRVALVIGNGAYSHATQLPNPKNDARAIAAELTRIGFKVSAHEDLGGQSFRMALGMFAQEAHDADLAVVFYAGHGIEIDGQNFLIPTDAKMASDSTAQFEAIRLDDVVASVRAAGIMGLVMLDACRDNPFATTMLRRSTTRAVSRGLAPVTLTGDAGTLVSFAAQAGHTAADGDGMHSPYTEALLGLLGSPDLEVGTLFQKVTKAVKDKTDGQQKPMFHIQPPEDLVYLVPVGQPIPPKPQERGTGAGNGLVAFLNAVKSGQRAPLEDFIARYPDHEKLPDAKRLLLNFAEQDLWAKLQTQNTVNGYETYLIAFPDGRFAQDAQNRIDALQAAAQPQVVETPTPQPTPTNQAKPSFDCTRASTAIEKTICRNSALADQDRALARSYTQSRAAGQVSSGQQKLWVKLRRLVCRSDIRDCVHAITNERLRSLSQAGGANTQRPSYSCTRASTAVEMAICRHGPLALQDKVLVRHYKRSERMSGQSQSSWIKTRERTCGARKGTDVSLCVADLTAKRIQQARPNGEDLHMGE